MATSPYFSTSNQYIKYDIHADVVSQSIADNTSQVRVIVYCWRTNNYTTDRAGTCYVNIDGVSYSNSWEYGQKPISYNSDTVLFDRTVTVSHAFDGTKNLYVEAKINEPNGFSSSYNGFTTTLPTIARQATISNAPNFTDESNPQITYSNPAGDSVTSLQACISLDGSTALIAYRDINKNGTSYTFELTSSERNSLLASTPNSNSKTVYFIIKTVIAGNTYYSSKTATMAVVNANPSYSGDAYADTNSSTVAITGDNQKIIQNHSILAFSFASIMALKNATLASIAITINAVTVSQSLSGSSASNVSVVFGTLNSASNINASIVITDSRGNTTAFTKEIEVYAWKLPTAIVKATRQENYYAPTTIYADADYSSLGGNNQITITWYYKETTASSYTLGGNLTDGGSTVISLDNEKAWDIKFEIADLLGTTIYNITVAEGIPILFLDKKLRSIGIGTLPTEYNELCVDRRVEIKNPYHESVMDLWSKSENYGTPNYFASASMYVKDQDDKILTRVSAFRDSILNSEYGDVTTYNEDGKRLTRLGISSSGDGFICAFDKNGNQMAEIYGMNGGHLWIANEAGDYIGGFYPNTNPNDATKGGGSLELKNYAGKTTVSLYTGYNSEAGLLYLNDNNANNKIKLDGSNGEITCDHVKASNGIVELFDGSLSSGNTTFNYGDYNAYLIFAVVRSGGSLLQMTIPKILLTTSDQQFCLNDEVDYITFKMKYASNIATLSFNSASSFGSIVKVYGMY